MGRYVTAAVLTLFIGLPQVFAQSAGKDVSKAVENFFPENSFQDAFMSPDSTVHVTLRYYPVIMDAMYFYSKSGREVAQVLYRTILKTIPEVFEAVPGSRKVELRCIQVPNDAAGGPTITRCWFSADRNSLGSKSFKNALAILPHLNKTREGQNEILKVFTGYYLDARTRLDLMQ